MSKEKKENSRKNLLFWIFSVIFIVGGFTNLIEQTLYGIFALAAGVIIFPPIIKIIKEKSKGKAENWMFVTAFIVLLVFGGMANLDSNTYQNQIAESSNSNQDNQQVSQPTLKKTYIVKTYDNLCREFDSGSGYTSIQIEKIFEDSYEGMYVILSGSVKNIDTSIFNNLILEVDMSCGTGKIYMNKDQYNKLLLLNKGETVTFSGKFNTKPTSKFFGGVHFVLKDGEVVNG